MLKGFKGEFNHSIDAKGRVILPARFREQLGEEFVMTVGLDGCLFIYPNDEWEIFAEQLRSLPGNKDGRQLQRFFYSNATTCEIDKQGRVLIPAKLRSAAALEKDIVFLGIENKIEVWSRERWDANNTFDGMDDVAERMSDFGIRF